MQVKVIPLEDFLVEDNHITNAHVTFPSTSMSAMFVYTFLRLNKDIYFKQTSRKD